jgi:formiminoglutamase
MLEHWLSPVSVNISDTINSLSKDQFGRNIAIHFDKLTDLKKVNIAILGISENEANAVRKSLFSLSYPFHQLRIADLGNIRNNDPSFIIPVITELLESKILPILIGRNPDNAFAQFKAYQELKKSTNIVCVDEKIQYSYNLSDSYYLNSILQIKESNLFNLGIIAFQSHFTANPLMNMMAENSFDTLRLGKIKSSIEEAEPIIRDADMLTYHLGALKQSEAPAVENPSPSGLFSEEACKLCHYAGMSDKLTSFGIYGLHAEKDQNQQSAQIIAQMVWYFIDGYDHRRGDFPASMDGLIEYIVELKHIDQPITFWKSKRSGRWWMQIPVKTQKKHERHRLLPCSYEDYTKACNDQLPDRLLNAYKRFS